MVGLGLYSFLSVTFYKPGRRHADHVDARSMEHEPSPTARPIPSVARLSRGVLAPVAPLSADCKNHRPEGGARHWITTTDVATLEGDIVAHMQELGLGTDNPRQQPALFAAQCGQIWNKDQSLDVDRVGQDRQINLFQRARDVAVFEYSKQLKFVKSLRGASGDDARRSLFCALYAAATGVGPDVEMGTLVVNEDGTHSVWLFQSAEWRSVARTHDASKEGKAPAHVKTEAALNVAVEKALRRASENGVFHARLEPSRLLVRRDPTNGNEYEVVLGDFDGASVRFGSKEPEDIESRFWTMAALLRVSTPSSTWWMPSNPEQLTRARIQIPEGVTPTTTPRCPPKRLPEFLADAFQTRAPSKPSAQNDAGPAVVPNVQTQATELFWELLGNPCVEKLFQTYPTQLKGMSKELLRITSKDRKKDDPHLATLDVAAHETLTVVTDVRGDMHTLLRALDAAILGTTWARYSCDDENPYGRLRDEDKRTLNDSRIVFCGGLSGTTEDRTEVSYTALLAAAAKVAFPDRVVLCRGAWHGILKMTAPSYWNHPSGWDIDEFNSILEKIHLSEAYLPKACLVTNKATGERTLCAMRGIPKGGGSCHWQLDGDEGRSSVVGVVRGDSHDGWKYNIPTETTWNNTTKHHDGVSPPLRVSVPTLRAAWTTDEVLVYDKDDGDSNPTLRKVYMYTAAVIGGFCLDNKIRYFVRGPGTHELLTLGQKSRREVRMKESNSSSQCTFVSFASKEPEDDHSAVWQAHGSNVKYVELLSADAEALHVV